MLVGLFYFIIDDSNVFLTPVIKGIVQLCIYQRFNLFLKMKSITLNDLKFK